MSKKKLIGNTGDSFSLKNKTVQRLGVVINWQRPSNNALVPDYKKVLITATLKRGGKMKTLFRSNLRNLLTFSSFFGGLEHILFPMSYAPIMSGSGSTTNRQIAGLIDLGDVINLNGSDEIFVEVQMIDGWIGMANATNIQANTIEFEWRETIGNEKATPIIETINIPTGNSIFSHSLGENVSKIALISPSVLPVNTTNALITQFKLNSDRYNLTDTFEHMLARRNTQFEDFVTGSTRMQNFMYVPHTEINQANLELNLNPSNITAENLTLMYSRYDIDGQTLERFVNRGNKHAHKDEIHLRQQLNK